MKISKVPNGDRIDDLFVEGPDLVPLHEDDGLGATLRDDELLQTLDRHAASQDTAHRREARVIPAVHQALVNEPGELSLGQNRVSHVQT